jgi:hypothetical protein
MRHLCPRCGTQYLSARECDWCPEVFTRESPEEDVPVLTDDCPGMLEQAKRKILELAPKAARWDALVLACHRFGNRCSEIVKYVEERVRWRN